MDFGLSATGDRVTVGASVGGSAIHLATVDEINDLLDPVAGAKDNENWHFLLLENEWLAARRV